MLKFENVAKVGDLIKAFDFMPMEGRPNSFIIGEVIDKGAIKHPEFGVTMFHGYTVRVIMSDSGSENFDAKREGIEMYVPYEMDITEFDNRVELYATAEAYEEVSDTVAALEA